MVSTKTTEIPVRDTLDLKQLLEVLSALKRGDLSRRMPLDQTGIAGKISDILNDIIDQNDRMVKEFERISNEVGQEGKISHRISAVATGGSWAACMNSVNSLIGNLVQPNTEVMRVIGAVAGGDLSRNMSLEIEGRPLKGEFLRTAKIVNTMVDQLNSFASEVTRVAREVGTEGKLGGQADVRGVAGTWKDLTDSVNFMAGNLTGQVRDIAEVTKAVATGDLSKKITVDVKGEILELKDTINTMVDQLNSFASEVTRVAREVGTEGKLGGQADVRGVAGTWKDLTDSVNFMANNLTTQVRGIAKVVTSVANGDLKKKLYLEAKGEIAELSDTINDMIDTLGLFGDQVTTVAREVGIEGKLGGQASVPGAAGLWRDLTDNVNQLASNLTTQVRAIAEVATGVTKGDLSRTVMVKAAGEVAALSDNINEMIRNLRETTRINTEQDWLKTNLAKFTRLLQGQRNLVNVSKLILSELAPLVSAQHGAFFITENAEEEASLKLLVSYAYQERKNVSNRFDPGEGLVGQCYLERKRILLTQVPNDYIKISSALGESAPLNIVVLPVLFEGEVKAIIELASFPSFTPIHLNFLDQLTESIGIVLNTIAAGMRTEELLIQSQTLTEELQGRQEELTKTNERLEEQAKSLQASEDLLKEQREELQDKNDELEEKARLLARKNNEVERKNMEVEQARHSLEEKARQLALTSRYKSEFLANMSHELRTPLNNMLILSRLLYDNENNNLSIKQIEYARTIHSSGNDLLQLINDILDLSKIESGKMTVDLDSVSFQEFADYLERSFRETARNKELEFQVDLNVDLPARMTTDLQRLQQILRNLLSNAFKFTHKGGVRLVISPVKSGWGSDHQILNQASSVIAFSVIDTGIGIPLEKQTLIFEAFRQADGSTSRKYGGTGLGLSISKEITRLLGGELRLTSQSNTGSTFTLYLPIEYIPTDETQTAGEQTEWIQSNGISNRVNPVILSESFSKRIPRRLVEDDRSSLSGDTILIIEEDEAFAMLLLEISRKNGFKGLVALDGKTGFSLLKDFPVQAVLLDHQLPDMNGWLILNWLKKETKFRHIPVQIISEQNEWRRSLRMGALSHITKPIEPNMIQQIFDTFLNFKSKKSRSLLIIDGSEETLKELRELLGERDLSIKTTENAREAISFLMQDSFDCIYCSFKLPDMSFHDFLLEISHLGKEIIPIVLNIDSELSQAQEAEIQNLKSGFILKEVESPELAAEEISIFLHQPIENITPLHQKLITETLHNDQALKGRKVLIVDDDVRNIFALTSVLEQHKMKIEYAENARDGIELLKKVEGVEVVLMDVMMPDMDGYEAMRCIRADENFAQLPIVALTAKAMKGDREKCIDAGATDYITKPVSVDQLLSLLRVLLCR
ncbi:response regulator receiver domain protein [Leptospira broomii serovar Hurstbridge str. 5399]|uniref:histidine kinase n=1 Tax=Leptospira broomii serovar Hurstbridge str. 5399 TaxID=1049789 RepID=T0G8P8_9LEPT|nr:response regulator [Leptospira broomii]EQA43194.1 response regulator receiver domain protein [Leptospira broomii serovar Hurstbridge str. 5399]